LRREPDYFEDGESLVLIYIAKKLKESLALEALLTQREVDYLVEVDMYSGGIIFRSERAGAFFYVREAERDEVSDLMRENRYSPMRDME
jgi:hypothetical protein